MAALSFKLVCFDLNETLIEENTWVDLNTALGVTPEEDEELMADYEEGKTTYEEWMRRLEKIYVERGLGTKEKILDVIHKYTYKRGAKELVSYLSKKGYAMALLSGTFDLLVESVANELSIPLYAANNQFVFDESGRLKGIETSGMDSSAKRSKLLEFCEGLKINPTECVCIGDGLSDRDIFKITEHGITFTNSRVKNLAWKSVEALEDIKEIL